MSGSSPQTRQPNDGQSHCGYETADGSPCQNSASEPDGFCHLHTDLETVDAGRPSKFEQCRDGILQLAKQGFDIKTIANKIGICEKTFHNWLNNKPQFGWEFRLARPENQRRRFEHCSNKVTFECEYCGSINEKIAWKVQQNKHNFCGESCYRKWDSEQKTKISGEFRYGSGWNKTKKREVRNRDDGQCVRCGLSNADHVEKYGRQLHVHHIKKARSFDDPEPRNDKSNLVTLCRSCHDYADYLSDNGLRVEFVFTDESGRKE